MWNFSASFVYLLPRLRSIILLSTSVAAGIFIASFVLRRDQADISDAINLNAGRPKSTVYDDESDECEYNGGPMEPRGGVKPVDGDVPSIEFAKISEGKGRNLNRKRQRRYKRSIMGRNSKAALRDLHEVRHPQLDSNITRLNRKLRKIGKSRVGQQNFESKEHLDLKAVNGYDDSFEIQFDRIAFNSHLHERNNELFSGNFDMLFRRSNFQSGQSYCSSLKGAGSCRRYDGFRATWRPVGTGGDGGVDSQWCISDLNERSQSPEANIMPEGSGNTVGKSSSPETMKEPVQAILKKRSDGTNYDGLTRQIEMLDWKMEDDSSQGISGKMQSNDIAVRTQNFDVKQTANSKQRSKRKGLNDNIIQVSEYNLQGKIEHENLKVNHTGENMRGVNDYVLEGDQNNECAEHKGKSALKHKNKYKYFWRKVEAVSEPISANYREYIKDAKEHAGDSLEFGSTCSAVEIGKSAFIFADAPAFETTGCSSAEYSSELQPSAEGAIRGLSNEFDQDAIFVNINQLASGVSSGGDQCGMYADHNKWKLEDGMTEGYRASCINNITYPSAATILPTAAGKIPEKLVIEGRDDVSIEYWNTEESVLCVSDADSDTYSLFESLSFNSLIREVQGCTTKCSSVSENEIQQFGVYGLCYSNEEDDEGSNKCFILDNGTNICEPDDQAIVNTIEDVVMVKNAYSSRSVGSDPKLCGNGGSVLPMNGISVFHRVFVKPVTDECSSIRETPLKCGGTYPESNVLYLAVRRRGGNSSVVWHGIYLSKCDALRTLKEYSLEHVDLGKKPWTFRLQFHGHENAEEFYIMWKEFLETFDLSLSALLSLDQIQRSSPVLKNLGTPNKLMFSLSRAALPQDSAAAANQIRDEWSSFFLEEGGICFSWIPFSQWVDGAANFEGRMNSVLHKRRLRCKNSEFLRNGGIFCSLGSKQAADKFIGFYGGPAGSPGPLRLCEELWPFVGDFATPEELFNPPLVIFRSRDIKPPVNVGSLI